MEGAAAEKRITNGGREKKEEEKNTVGGLARITKSKPEQAAWHLHIQMSAAVSGLPAYANDAFSY